MLMQVMLVNGRTQWVNGREARMLQGERKIICALAIKDEESSEFPSFCNIRNDYCSSDASLFE